jgi:hypothetical protein
MPQVNMGGDERGLNRQTSRTAGSRMQLHQVAREAERSELVPPSLEYSCLPEFEKVGGQ